MNLSKTFFASLLLLATSGCGLSDLFATHPRATPTPAPPHQQKQTTDTFGTYAMPEINAPSDIIMSVDLTGDANAESTLTSETNLLITALIQNHVDFHLTIIDASTDVAVQTPTVITGSDASPTNEATSEIHAIALAQASEHDFDPAGKIILVANASQFSTFFRVSAKRIYLAITSGTTTATPDLSKLAVLDHQASPATWTLFTLSTDTTDTCNGDYFSQLSSGQNVCGISSLHSLMVAIEGMATSTDVSISFRDAVPLLGGIATDHVNVYVNGTDWTSFCQIDTTTYTVHFNTDYMPPAHAEIKVDGFYYYFVTVE